MDFLTTKQKIFETEIIKKSVNFGTLILKLSYRIIVVSFYSKTNHKRLC